MANCENLITNFIAKDFDGWDEVGDGDIQLYNATLQVDTPKFKKGDKVENIAFLYTLSKCQIINKEGDVVDEFPIKLVIGN